MFAEVMTSLTARRALSDEQMQHIMRELMAARLAEAEAAAFLVALRMKGETAAELAAAARVLREHMLRWDPGRPVLDTCGTGGDNCATFNISTATALVVAGAGAPVVKHGNRSVSSRSGSADVLAALGVHIEGDAGHARRTLDHAGLAFCFAPQFHPAVRNLAPLRRRLGIATLFNWLGPLANPAGARHQLLGVGRPELLELMAGALAELGTTRALLVCSRDGLDEVSLSAPTQVREVGSHGVREDEWTAADFGLEPCHLGDLRTDGAQASAAVIQSVLRGDEGPALRVVLANAAAALVAAEQADSLKAGVEKAAAAVFSGNARRVLVNLVACNPS